MRGAAVERQPGVLHAVSRGLRLHVGGLGELHQGDAALG